MKSATEKCDREGRYFRPKWLIRQLTLGWGLRCKTHYTDVEVYSVWVAEICLLDTPLGPRRDDSFVYSEVQALGSGPAVVFFTGEGDSALPRFPGGSR